MLAASLRYAVTSVGPVLTEVGHDLRLSGLQASVLGMLPLVMFSLGGAVTPALTRQIGAHRAAALAMVLATAGTVARAVAPDATAFLGAQLVALAGMGLGNVLLPPLVKRHFPDHIGSLTAAYGICLQLGTAGPAFLAVPLADTVGWRGAMGAWAALSLVALLPWLVLGRGPAETGGLSVRNRIRVQVLLRNRVAWAAALVMGTTSLNTYAVITWLPRMLADAGVDRAVAGSLLGLYSLMSIPLAVGVPWLAVRLRNPFCVVLAGLACYAGGYAGLAIAPSRAPLLWTVLIGTAAVGFPLALCLATLRTATHEGAVALSGFMQGFGYLLASLGPLATGILHSLTGGWTASIGFLLLTLVPLTAGAAVFCRPVLLEATLPATLGPTGPDTAGHVSRDAGHPAYDPL